MVGTARFMTNLWAFNAITRSIESLLNKRHRRRFRCNMWTRWAYFFSLFFSSERYDQNFRSKQSLSNVHEQNRKRQVPDIKKTKIKNKQNKTKYNSEITNGNSGLTGGRCARSNVSQCNNARINRFIRSKWTCVWVQMYVLTVGQTRGNATRIIADDALSTKQFLTDIKASLFRGTLFAGSDCGSIEWYRTKLGTEEDLRDVYNSE